MNFNSSDNKDIPADNKDCANFVPTWATSELQVIDSFARLFLKTVIVTCVIAYRAEIEQRDIRWKIFIQEEIILTDAL